MSQTITNLEKGDIPGFHTKASCFQLRKLFFLYCKKEIFVVTKYGPFVANLNDNIPEIHKCELIFHWGIPQLYRTFEQ